MRRQTSFCSNEIELCEGTEQVKFYIGNEKIKNINEKKKKSKVRVDIYKKIAKSIKKHNILLEKIILLKKKKIINKRTAKKIVFNFNDDPKKNDIFTLSLAKFLLRNITEDNDEALTILSCALIKSVDDIFFNLSFSESIFNNQPEIDFFNSSKNIIIETKKIINNEIQDLILFENCTREYSRKIIILISKIKEKQNIKKKNFKEMIEDEKYPHDYLREIYKFRKELEIPDNAFQTKEITDEKTKEITDEKTKEITDEKTKELTDEELTDEELTDEELTDEELTDEELTDEELLKYWSYILPQKKFNIWKYIKRKIMNLELEYDIAAHIGFVGIVGISAVLVSGCIHFFDFINYTNISTNV